MYVCRYVCTYVQIYVAVICSYSYLLFMRAIVYLFVPVKDALVVPWHSNQSPMPLVLLLLLLLLLVTVGEAVLFPSKEMVVENKENERKILKA